VSESWQTPHGSELSPPFAGMQKMALTELVLTGIDQEVYNDPAHYRLVLFIEGGGKLAVWGRRGNTGNVDAVKDWIDNHGFPLTVSCVWTEPEPWARVPRIGHTDWLEEPR
jgi:hypothetical protein